MSNLHIAVSKKVNSSVCMWKLNFKTKMDIIRSAVFFFLDLTQSLSFISQGRKKILKTWKKYWSYLFLEEVCLNAKRKNEKIYDPRSLEFYSMIYIHRRLSKNLMKDQSLWMVRTFVE